MRAPRFVSLAQLCSLISVVAADLVYVTDLQIYTLLAPCAQDAISAVIQYQTQSACGEAVEDLQSCVCTKDNNRAVLSTEISSSVSRECGSTASEDQSSAYVVYSQYCDQDATLTFALPTENIVSAYPTDLPAYSNLAPCAQYGVSVALQSMTYELCPEPASLLAPCACKKNQNSLRASQTINSSVKYSCGNNADITSAQQFLSAYCGMVDGTTAFPVPTNPPGDMSYYITALPAYSSLAPCAQSGVSGALRSHSSDLCPEGPQAMASCACLKLGMSSLATSLMSSSVKYYCESTAIEDVNSALAVFDFYCSAARKEVVATDVAESIGQTYATGDGVGSAQGPGETGGSGGDGAGSSKGDGGDGKEGGAPGGVNMAAIAGGVVGVVGALAIIGTLIFFMWKKRMSKKKPEIIAYNKPPGTSNGSHPDVVSDKPELAGTPILAPPPPPSPHPSLGNNGTSRTDTVSPVSAYSNTQSAFTPPAKAAELQNGAPPMPELQGGAYMAHQQQPQQMMPELQGGQGYVQPPPHQLRPELAGGPAYPQQGYMPQELHGGQMYGQPPAQGYAPPPGQPAPQEAYGRPVYPGQQQQQPQYPAAGYYAPPGQQPPRAELAGASWQAGPVQGYQELDSNYRPR